MNETTAEDRRGRGRPRAYDRDTALRAALRLFWKKGYSPVSVADLCGVMNMSPPSLYAAFGNKPALFLEALRYYTQTFWQEPGQRLMANPDIFSAIYQYFQDAAEILASPDEPGGSMITLAVLDVGDDEKEILEELGAARAATTELFSRRMRMAIKDGQIPADTDVPVLAGCLAAFLDGLALQARQNLFLSRLKAMAAYAPRLLPGYNGAICQEPDLASLTRRRRILAMG